MADPDPNFVPIDGGSRHSDRNPPTARDDYAQIDQAMEDLGRAIAQAALIEKQALEAKCRQVPEALTREQRFAWAASCRYSRH
jgi:hypothetical protein